MCELKLWIIGDNFQHGPLKCAFMIFCSFFYFEIKSSLFGRILLTYVKITSTDNT